MTTATIPTIVRLERATFAAGKTFGQQLTSEDVKGLGITLAATAAFQRWFAEQTPEDAIVIMGHRDALTGETLLRYFTDAAIWGIGHDD